MQRLGSCQGSGFISLWISWLCSFPIVSIILEFPSSWDGYQEQPGLCAVNYSALKWLEKGLPWWSSGRESAFQCWGHGFDPWSGNWDLTCHGATKPACHNYWACMPQWESPCAVNYRVHALWTLCTTTTEPMRPGACAPQLERENPHATTREKPVLQQKIPHASRKTTGAATKTWRSKKKNKENK